MLTTIISNKTMKWKKKELIENNRQLWNGPQHGSECWLAVDPTPGMMMVRRCKPRPRHHCWRPRGVAYLAPHSSRTSLWLDQSLLASLGTPSHLLQNVILLCSSHPSIWYMSDLWLPWGCSWGPSLPQLEEVAPVPDLLGSILSRQSMLLMDSSDVVINRDGSLKANKPGEQAARVSYFL